MVRNPVSDAIQLPRSRFASNPDVSHFEFSPKKIIISVIHELSDTKIKKTVVQVNLLDLNLDFYAGYILIP